MKFSVLLPTRNRLELLRYAIQFSRFAIKRIRIGRLLSPTTSQKKTSEDILPH